jgi:hypothetical protein
VRGRARHLHALCLWIVRPQAPLLSYRDGRRTSYRQDCEHEKNQPPDAVRS